MTEFPRRGIPAQFQRMDTRTTAVDQFANAHDLQMYRSNHNALMARRARTAIFAKVFNTDSGFSDPLLWRTISSPGIPGGFVLLVPVRLSPGTKQCTMTIYAAIGDATSGPDVSIYPMVAPIGQLAAVNSNSPSVAVTSTAETKYTLTFDIHPEMRDSGIGRLAVYANGGMYGPDLKAATVVADRGIDWVDSTTGFGSAFVGSAVYFPNDLDVAPFVVTRGYNVSGSIYRHFSDGPIDPQIEIGDAINVRAMQTLKLYSLSVYEAPVATSFYQQVLVE